MTLATWGGVSRVFRLCFLGGVGSNRNGGEFPGGVGNRRGLWLLAGAAEYRCHGRDARDTSLSQMVYARCGRDTGGTAVVPFWGRWGQAELDGFVAYFGIAAWSAAE
jgi:hypothetical protein